ncbi:hypothetical protein AURDEDRAFT_115122 [Auricularia subglabra TFB-10046 SS5]|nr:hypothetical protein AURDEDRAFT_115122 [Auricularia subglabra TFB-10046 SS5]
MAPSSLQGLNIIDAGSPAAMDDYTGLPPDLAAQLDLWKYMHFSHEDDGLGASFGGLGKSSGAATLDDLVRMGEEELAQGDTAAVSTGPAEPAVPGDFGHLFSVDPFLVAPSPSLTTTSPFGASSSEPSPPAPKKARNRKASDARPATPPPSDTPLNATEDKRRRNTAASARFRAKKKEREAALEHRAKELEVRVGELERECEALRRENGWLKGLVVGVTQAGGAPTDLGVGVSVGKRKRESA